MANYSHLLGQLVIARAVVLSQASLYSICSAGVFQMQPFGLLIVSHGTIKTNTLT